MKTRVCLAMLLTVAALPAQSTFGAILGAVNDTSGAAVATAALTLRNLDENTASATLSGPSGLYQFVNLKSGRYQLTAAHAGFNTAISPDVSLDARQARRIDFI